MSLGAELRAARMQPLHEKLCNGLIPYFLGRIHHVAIRSDDLKTQSIIEGSNSLDPTGSHREAAWRVVENDNVHFKRLAVISHEPLGSNLSIGGKRWSGRLVLRPAEEDPLFQNISRRRDVSTFVSTGGHWCMSQLVAIVRDELISIRTVRSYDDHELLIDWIEAVYALLPQNVVTTNGIQSVMLPLSLVEASARAVEVLIDKPEWRFDALGPEISEASVDGPRKRNKVGPRRTTEELFKAALRKHHKCDNGSVLNPVPISTRDVEKLTESQISDSTARRQFIHHFGSVEEYQTACLSGAINAKLVVLLGDALHAFASFDPSSRDVEDGEDG